MEFIPDEEQNHKERSNTELVEVMTKYNEKLIKAGVRITAKNFIEQSMNHMRKIIRPSANIRNLALAPIIRDIVFTVESSAKLSFDFTLFIIYQKFLNKSWYHGQGSYERLCFSRILRREDVLGINVERCDDVSYVH